MGSGRVPSHPTPPAGNGIPLTLLLTPEGRVHGPAVSTSEHLRLREGVRAQSLREEGSQVQQEGVGAASGTGTGAAGPEGGAWT